MLRVEQILRIVKRTVVLLLWDHLGCWQLLCWRLYYIRMHLKEVVDHVNGRRCAVGLHPCRRLGCHRLDWLNAYWSRLGHLWVYGDLIETRLVFLNFIWLWLLLVKIDRGLLWLRLVNIRWNFDASIAERRNRQGSLLDLLLFRQRRCLNLQRERALWSRRLLIHLLA